jgi:biotin carboxyl carrier protein
LLYRVQVGDETHRVGVRKADGRFVVTIGSRECVVDAVQVDRHTVSLLIENAGHTISREVIVAPDRASGSLSVHLGAVVLAVALNGRRRRHDARADSTVGSERIVAPMPGKIVRVLAKPGDEVSPRQPVVVIEAMKMENELRAGRNGVVAQVAVEPGQSVDAGALLLVIAEK